MGGDGFCLNLYQYAVCMQWEMDFLFYTMPVYTCIIDACKFACRVETMLYNDVYML